MTEQEILLTEILQCSWIDLYTQRPILTTAQEERYAHLRERRQNGEPLQYLIGHSDFMGLRLYVDPRVLIPRPETEILVEKTIDIARSLFAQRPLKILDLGTGSGNIAIALAKFLSESTVTALDISSDAICVAQRNARQHYLENKIQLRCVDMISFLMNPASEYFDIIVSNPPYIATSQMQQLPIDVQQEPNVAFNGGDDGLDFYRLIIAHSDRHLNAGGLLCLEVGVDQAQAVCHLLRQHTAYQRINIYPDYRQIPRIVCAHKDIAIWKN